MTSPQRTFAATRVGGPNGSMLLTRVGGRTYSSKLEPRCKTCNSPYRSQIESALIKSYGYTAIVRSLPDDAGLTTTNIMDHFKKGHLPLDESVRRVLIEEDARERNLDIEGYETTLGNHLTLAKLGVQQVMQDMMEGTLKPDVKDGIAFANLLMKVEEKAGADLDMVALTQGFVVYMNAIQQVCSPEQMRQITESISSNPVMAALLSRSSQEDVIDVDPEPEYSEASGY